MSKPEDVCEDQEHPAFHLFVLQMRRYRYGRDPMLQAWHFFRAGWDTHAAWEPSVRGQSDG